jgi:methyl-accepting chemotaxis protein
VACWVVIHKSANKLLYHKIIVLKHTVVDLNPKIVERYVKNLKISTLLTIGFAALLGLVALMAGFGLLQVSKTNHAIDAIYKDRVIPLQQLNTMGDMYTINIMDAANKMSVGNLDSANALKLHDQGLKEINTQWSAYTATKLTDEEAAVVAKTQDLMKKVQPELATLRDALVNNRNDSVMQNMNTLEAAVSPVRAQLRQLVEIQLKEAKAQHALSEVNFQTTIMLFALVVVLAIALGCITGVWIVRSITTPLRQAVNVALQVAGGDLTLKIEQHGPQETARLLGTLKEMQDSLVDVVASVRSGSEGVASASAEIALGNQDLSDRTERQAGALEETAASMQDLSTAVNKNAASARQANQLAGKASEVAIKGGSAVSQVVDTMKGINEASQKIADIIGVIDGIAFQTNILALNAAVEAARAGEQGRGFAVVASEVRALAGRSAAAAKEIKTLIGDSVERVARGSALVDQAGATMDEVVNSIRQVTDIMGEITSASDEQSLGVQQVGEAVNQMDQATQQNAALVEEMAAAASSLKSLANDQVQAVSVFKLPNDPGRSLIAYQS